MADFTQQNIAPGAQPDADNYIFALDIGTRSIIGLVGYQEEELFRICALELREHPSRAMADGQIEDIRQVARTAALVKRQLEERVGFALTKVNVAAAGRALRTGKATFEMNVNTGEGITQRQIHELEMGAISLVREELDAAGDSVSRFYCVGHAVVRYSLDDYPFSTILGHRGEVARAQVIATFLPAEVVDSLCAAMATIGCEIRNLTLEPIAAMNAVIPAELRLLNLALVDIGAGTSDIALCDNGCVSGYTMATIAGDEITEEIIKRYLVDFQTAERMKHAAARGEAEIAYNDILGFDYTITLAELVEALRPATEQLSREICSRILETNGRAPAAVFMVGGGSLTPLLCGMVADGLQLDHKKVAIGGNNFIRRVASADEDISGPAYATPIGIALTASAAGAQSGFYVYINDKKVQLFRNDVMTVLDVLLLCGYQYHELLGRNGRSVTYRLNGQKMILRGEHLRPAQILINGLEASVSTQVGNADRLCIVPAVSGADARLTLTDIGIDPEPFDISINGVTVSAGRRVLVNGQPAELGQEIHDLDILDALEVLTLRDACVQSGIDPEGKIFSSEGVQRELDSPLYPGDDILSLSAAGTQPVLPVPKVWPFKPEPVAAPVVTEPVQALVPEPMPERVRASEVAAMPEIAAAAEVAAMPEIAAAPEGMEQPKRTPEPVLEEPAASPAARVHPPMMRVTLNDNAVLLPAKEDRMPYQFIDMLNLVDLDPTRPQGNILLLLNGKSASYLDEIRNGDTMEIRWENA